MIWALRFQITSALRFLILSAWLFIVHPRPCVWQIAQWPLDPRNPTKKTKTVKRCHHHAPLLAQVKEASAPEDSQNHHSSSLVVIVSCATSSNARANQVTEILFRLRLGSVYFPGHCCQSFRQNTTRWRNSPPNGQKAPKFAVP